MKPSTDQLLAWLKLFTDVWLVENIPNDVHIVDSIKTKLQEFEQLLIDQDDAEEEYHRAQLLNDDTSSNSDIEQTISASTTLTHSTIQTCSLAISSDIQHQSNLEIEEQSRKILLEQSDDSLSENEKVFASDDDKTMLQPIICLKRILRGDAEQYLPESWKTARCTVNSGKTSSILPQTNEIESDYKLDTSSSSLSTSSTSDDEFNIKTRFTKSSRSEVEKSPMKLRNRNNRSRKKHDIIITYNPSTVEAQSSPDEAASNESSVTDEKGNEINQDSMQVDVLENNNIESIVLSLDTPLDTPQAASVVQDNADNESTHQMEPSTTEDLKDDRLLRDVPSYAHLLAKSLSSDSDGEHSNVDKGKKSSINEKKRTNNIKRVLSSLSSSSNSDASKPKKKLKGSIKKKRAVLSSLLTSSEDEENESTSTLAEATPISSPKQSSSRVKIRRSSSEDSKDNSKRSRNDSTKKRRKSDAHDESSTSSRTSDSTLTDHEDSMNDSESTIENSTQETSDKTNAEDISSSTKRKKGRKNIRKIIDDKRLQNRTKDAIEAERERRQRIAEKQKLYNDTLLEQSSYVSQSGNDELNSSNRRLILEINKETNEALVEVSPKLVEYLKPHQQDGIRFLWNNVFESIDAIKKKKQNGNGCILAHCMGLGKTLQVISFIHTVFNYDKITKVKTCLVLCPINVALNWTNEFEYWLTGVDPPVEHYQLTTVKPNLRLTHLNFWYESGGVIIMGYEMYRRLANGVGIKNKKLKADAYKCLVDPGPDIVVADEGHILKNAKTALAKCLSKIKTPRRIVLTGTPLQNNLLEYYCMVSFIKPSILGSQSEYINRFVNPIQNGQHRDSNEEDVRLMKRRACVLHELLTGFVDRKDYSLLKEHLPPKFEYIINIRLSDLQSKLYDIYLKQQVDKAQRTSALKKDFKSAKLFADYHLLQKICTHPFILYPHFINIWKQRINRDDDDDDDFIDDKEFEEIFIDDEEDNEKSKAKTKNSNGHDAIPQTETNFSGFLIDNVKFDVDEGEPNPSNNKRRTNSSSSTTTLDSDSTENSKQNSADLKSKSIDNDDDGGEEDVEIIKTYSTRSRTSTVVTNKPKGSSSTTNADELDAENNQVPNHERVNVDSHLYDNDDEPWIDDIREQFWFPFLDMLPKGSKFDLELSGKFVLLKFIIDKCAEIGDKILLFTRSLYSLDFIESLLHHIHNENEKEYQKQCESRRQLREILSSNGEHENIADENIPAPVQWIRDQDYFRMDGQTEVVTRKRYATAFNDPSNLRARLFLISTVAGGMGINLTGSNRVIVFDASWNPSHDTQAIFRSYRFGQEKPVYIYRFLAHGTMEEKIYQRQVVKQSISQRVVDDHQLDRHFSQNDIKELYNFKPEPLPEARSTSMLLAENDSHFNYPIPKDHLLLDLLYEHSQWVHSYHSHDSLLENKLDEGLSAEERRRALEEYENLKRMPDARQLAMQRLQQQQQQLNALIAHQQQMALAQAARPLQQNMHEIVGDMIFRSLQNPNENGFDFARTVQAIYAESARTTPKSAVKRTQQSNSTHQNTTANYIPIQPRPTTISMPVRNPGEVILLESDEEMEFDGTDQIPK